MENNIRQRSYIFALNTSKYIKSFAKYDFVLSIIVKQLVRSATSVGANIMEAQAASSRKDFANFLNHALKSVNESSYWLNLLKDLGYNSEILLKESHELGSILGASLVTLRTKS